MVAPHTGAWIETLLRYLVIRYVVVAPHTGAWIETAIQTSLNFNTLSHPTRVRGLKLNYYI